MVGRKSIAAFALVLAMTLAGCAGSNDAPKPASRDVVPAADEVAPVASEAEEQAAAEPEAEEAAEAPPQEPESPPQQPAEPTEEVEETTVFEKRLDVLVDETFYNVPDYAGLFTQTFEVAYPYQTLEAVGAYDLLPVWANDLEVTIKDSAGKTVISYVGLDSYVLLTGTGGSDDSFPIGYAYDVPLGTYTINVAGAGSNPVNIKVRGYLGADMDFTFHNSVTDAEDQVANYRGKVVLVDLMATWCGPCKAAMPGLKRIRDDYDGQVEIVSIDVDNTETDAELLAMRAEYDADWPFGFDDAGGATDAFGTGWIPSFGIIDQHGVLMFRHIGEMEESELRDIIDYALAER